MSTTFNFPSLPVFLPCGQLLGRFPFFVDPNSPPWPAESFRESSSKTELKCLVLTPFRKDDKYDQPTTHSHRHEGCSQCLPPESGYESSTRDS